MGRGIKRLIILVVTLASAIFVCEKSYGYSLLSSRTSRFFKDGKRFNFGKLFFLPKLLFKTTYDDNALYSPTNQDWDLIFNIVPGIDLEMVARRFDFSLRYDFNLHKNVKNTVQNFMGHYLNGEFYMTPFGRRVFVKLKNNFQITTEPADIEFLDRMDMKSNEAEAEVGYKTPGRDLDVSVAYVNYYRSYDRIWDGSTFTGNGIELRSKVKLSSKYRFLPKTQATFDFNYIRANQTFGQDVYGGDVVSNGYRFLLGIIGAFTRKLSLIGKVGYNRTNFNIQENSSDVLVETAITYIFTRKINAGVGFERKFDYSVYSPYKAYNNYNLKLRYIPKSKLQFVLTLDFYNINYSGPVTNGAGGLRKDFNIKFNFETIYRFRKWLSLTLGYWLQRRDSNMIRNEFQGTVPADFLRNTVYLSIGLNRF